MRERKVEKERALVLVCFFKSNIVACVSILWTKCANVGKGFENVYRDWGGVNILFYQSIFL